MKIIMISDRKYRYIHEKLMELEKQLKSIGCEKKPAPVEKIDNTDELYLDGGKSL